MATKTRQSYLLLLFFAVIYAAHAIQGARSRTQLAVVPHVQYSTSTTSTDRELRPQQQQQDSGGEEMELWGKSRRRMMIGSTAPTCTYNECRGCKYKCRAEQVPVEGNDPINSAYHYKCVCHRERRGAQQQLLQNPPQIQNSKPAAAPN
ncbi:uncharacterized protein LOC127787360 isoform X1 [Diospyros lotus]|uniref:uncharacterized protein LOC127787360 isoform X1 n=1 Tax=Diospyros lotus TaxID=55363 RepID=UPI0022547EF8|nr:uncharacterized protein LOC127787360 isoform X1 [Diospyros lotus]